MYIYTYIYICVCVHVCVRICVYVTAYVYYLIVFSVYFRTVIWNRRLDGCINRVPPDFYECVWQILEHTPGGLKVTSCSLKQVIDLNIFWNF